MVKQNVLYAVVVSCSVVASCLFLFFFCAQGFAVHQLQGHWDGYLWRSLPFLAATVGFALTGAYKMLKGRREACAMCLGVALVSAAMMAFLGVLSFMNFTNTISS